MADIKEPETAGGLIPDDPSLDRCLQAAGVDRGQAYVTNAVKHFKWVPRGTRRIHSKPGSMEIAACFPWLEAEIAAVKPRIIVEPGRSEEHTSELQSHSDLVCRLLLEKKNKRPAPGHC